jgi:hypothetical protein
MTMLAPSDAEELRLVALRALCAELATVEYHVMLRLPDDGRLDRLRGLIAKLEHPEAEAHLTTFLGAFGG